MAGEKLSNHRPEEELAEEVKPKVSVFKTKEQKRKEAEERQARSAAKKLAQGEAELLEKDIARMEARKKELVSALEDPENRGQGSRVVELNRELAALTEKLESANQRWLEKLELLEV